MFRSCVLLCLSWTLSGCWSPGSSAVFDSVGRVIADRSAVVLDVDRVRETGAGVLKVQIDDRSPVYLELNAVHPERFVLDFVSVDGAFFQLYNGQIRGTHRLGPSILNVNALAADPFFSGFSDIHPSKTYFWEINAPDIASGVVAESRYWFMGEERLETLYGTWDTRIVAESWEIADLDYRVENRYWVDADGIVIQSRQSPLPGLSTFYLTLESYRPRSMR